MKRIIRSAISLVMVLIAACSEDNPVGPLQNDFAFPLEVGNKWQYNRIFTQFNIRSQNPNPSFSDTTLLGSATLEIVRKDTLRDSLETFVVAETGVNAGRTFESENYYNNTKDGLFFYAYSGAGLIIPKSTAQKRFLYKGRHFSSIAEISRFLQQVVTTAASTDSLIFEEPPLKSLQYPLRVDLEWVYRKAGAPFGIRKKVVGTENVKTPAGEFNCVKIQWLIDVVNDVEFFDFISSEGLIERSITVHDVQVVDEQNPDGIGVIIDTRDESVLSDLDLQ